MKKKKQIRQKFRDGVYSRDNYTCKICETKRPEEELDAHHITDRNKMPNGGYVISNGITLCADECHMKAEQFHISGGEYWELGLHPDDLYKMINSSYEEAWEDSLKLL